MAILVPMTDIQTDHITPTRMYTRVNDTLILLTNLYVIIFSLRVGLCILLNEVRHYTVFLQEVVTSTSVSFRQVKLIIFQEAFGGMGDVDLTGGREWRGRKEEGESGGGREEGESGGGRKEGESGGGRKEGGREGGREERERGREGGREGGRDVGRGRREGMKGAGSDRDSHTVSQKLQSWPQTYTVS